LPQQLTKDTFQAALRQAARQPQRDCHASFSMDKQQILYKSDFGPDNMKNAKKTMSLYPKYSMLLCLAISSACACLPVCQCVGVWVSVCVFV